MPGGHDSIAMLAGLCEALDRVPVKLLKSVTFDQGSEWAEWRTIAATFDSDTWFCDPHSSWQRVHIEYQNRTWRFWFPRGTCLDNLDQGYVDHIAAIINGRRRRNLDHQSPASLYVAAAVQRPLELAVLVGIHHRLGVALPAGRATKRDSAGVAVPP